ncbi:hypothetical protein BHE74_00010082 [Ensete ventricosum]|nr:hypothetical protein BHE74_00010082 [Ensete ventricosum]
MRGVSQCLDDYEILSHIAGSEAKGKKTLVLATIDDRVEEAIETTKAEQVIAVPTTTLYGFACDGCLTSPFAITVSDVNQLPFIVIRIVAQRQEEKEEASDSVVCGPE